MRNEFVKKIEQTQRKYLPQTKELEKGNTITFKLYEEVVEFVSLYFVEQYCKDLRLRGQKVEKNTMKLREWNRQVGGIKIIYHTLRGTLWRLYYEMEEKRRTLWGRLKIMECNKIIISPTKQPEIYEVLIEAMNREGLPNNVFPLDDSYIIKLSQKNYSVFKE